jgi:two-component system OmpR family response regulator
LQIDLIQRRVRFQGEFIDLTPQEFSLLYVLAQASGEALSRSELLRRAWPDAIDNPRTIDTHVLSLRKKIEIDSRSPSLVQTVRNVGYRFNLELLSLKLLLPMKSSISRQLLNLKVFNLPPSEISVKVGIFAVLGVQNVDCYYYKFNLCDRQLM